MALKPQQLFRKSSHGSMVTPRVISNATVNGTSVATPWTEGTEMRFLFHGGAWPATTNLSATVQVQLISDDSWVSLRNSAGTTVEFLATKLDDAGAGEDATVSGTIDLTMIDSDIYKAVRMSVQNSVATSANVAVTYEIYGIYGSKTGTSDSTGLDDLWDLQKNL